MNNSKKI